MTQGARGKMCVMESKGELLTLLVPISSSLQMPCLQQISHNGGKKCQINRTVQMAEVKQKKQTLLFLMMRVALFEDTFDHGLSVTITRK